MKETLESLTQQTKTLWQEHRRIPFPEGFVGKDVNHIDLAHLEADIAGCVDTFLSLGNLDLQRTAVLGLCFRDSTIVQLVIDESGREHFARLEGLAELVLKAVAIKNHPQPQQSNE